MAGISDLSKNEGHRQILLCLAGGTPQIITESIYAITQLQKKPLDEVHVITTPTGRKKILDNLLNKKTGKFWIFCRDYRIDPATIKFDDATINLVGADKGRILEDLVTEEDNQAAIDHICRIVRELAKTPETTIHASVGGGRKTMGIALTMAMQLFGRTQDHLFHVLVNPDYESHSQFYYPRPKGQKLVYERGSNAGKQITSPAWVKAGEINFIRLGGVLSEWMSDEDINYKKLVRLGQDELDKQSSKLMFHLADDRISIANDSIELQPREFFIYLLLVRQCKREKEEASIRIKDITRGQLEVTFKQIAPNRNPESYRRNPGLEMSGIDDLSGYKYLKTLLEDVDSVNLSRLETIFSQVRSKVNSKMNDKKWPEKFRIMKEGIGMNASFGLKTSMNSFIIKRTSTN